MMKKIAVVLCVALLSSCTATNEDVGTIAGGVVGGVVGSQFGGGSGRVLAAGAGALIGAYLGGNIGRSMDKLDRLEMQRALETAPTGRAVQWRNPDNGNRYTVKPTRTYYYQKQHCREYTTKAIIGGKTQEVYGKACRQPDGAWRVVN
jgi:surface antigen